MKTGDSNPLRIVVLGLSGCPNLEATIRLVKSVALSLNEDAHVATDYVNETDDFLKIGFRGSPTVLINGVDIEGNVANDDAYVFGCRIYGTTGTPSRTMIESAVLAAIAGRQSEQRRPPL